MPVPAPEPVAAFVQASAALTLAGAACISRFTAALEPNPTIQSQHAPAACGDAMPVPAPEPVAAFVQASASLTRAVYALRLPRFAAELDPTPGLDLVPALDPPPVCERWMPGPAADPVFRYLQASTALAFAAPAAALAPAFALRTAAPYVPRIHQTVSAPRATAVMATVWPSAAVVPLSPIHRAVAILLPAIPRAIPEPSTAAAGPATVPAPEAVERLLVSAREEVPVSIQHRAPLRVAFAASAAVAKTAPEICIPVVGPAPEPLESMLVASASAHMAPAAACRMMPFAMEAGREGAIRPGFSTQALNPAARKPRTASPRVVAPNPISTLGVTPPAHAGLHLESGLPQAGLQPIEFHGNRLRSAPVGQPEWKTARLALSPPRFQLRPVLDKPEELLPAKPPTTPKEPVVLQLPNMPAGKKEQPVWMVAGRVAAGFLLAASLYWGVANFRVYHRVSVRDESAPSGAALTVANNAAGPGSAIPGGTPAKPAPKGAVAWVKHAISERAALRIVDDFRGVDKANWDGTQKAAPAGWTHSSDGYAAPGALALFRPSLKFTDYRLEFFGQIETKSIGWTVRASDAMNYHAMKLTVVEAGLRPFVALVHYDVVGGKPGRTTQTPLNVMVHNHAPMQFAVDVRGERVVTSIDGEEVDSFLDNTLTAGGVGFFSENGERARLYWMRISRNDDWLGHVCAMLAGGTSTDATAALCAPRLPGGMPAPATPGGGPGGGDDTTLAAAWIALPYLGANRKARFLKIWRSEPWNT
jgi:hypothetical protein